MRGTDLRRLLKTNPDLGTLDVVPGQDNPLAARFEREWAAAGGLAWVREHRFHEQRRWRFDYAWPALLVGLELEGGVWSGGRHLRGRGFIEDIAKYNAAVMLGWKVLRLGTGFRYGQVEEIATWMRSL